MNFPPFARAGRLARRGTVFVAAAATFVASALPGAAIGAQTPTRVGVARFTPCDELRGAPPALVRLPEGIAIIRLQRELATLEAMGASPRLAGEVASVAEARRMLEDAALTLIEAAAAPRDPRAERELVDARRAALVGIRELQPALARAMREAQRAAEVRPTRRGWLGLNISSVAVREEAGDLLRYCDYPVIESVDPGSPAERAGLAAGDSLRAFDGRDLLAAPIDMTALLRPGRVVRVGIHRDGRAREVPVTVGERPTRLVFRGMRDASAGDGEMRITVRADSADGVVRQRSIVTWLQGDTVTLIGDSITLRYMNRPLRAPGRATSVMAGAPFPPEIAYFRLDSLSAEARAGTVSEAPVARPSGVARAVGLRRRDPLPAPPLPAPVVLGADDGMVAGAQLSTVGPELRETLGLPAGVLVLRVLEGTPAADAGLRGGDVLRTADGRPLARVRDLLQLVDGAGATRRVELQVRRRGEADRRVTLRW